MGGECCSTPKTATDGVLCTQLATIILTNNLCYIELILLFDCIFSSLLMLLVLFLSCLQSIYCNFIVSLFRHCLVRKGGVISKKVSNLTDFQASEDPGQASFRRLFPTWMGSERIAWPTSYEG